jgi:hypothetical protein
VLDHGQDRDLLAGYEARDIGQFAAFGVAAWVVSKQVGHRGHAEGLLQRGRRLRADDALRERSVQCGHSTPTRSG